MIVLDDFEKNLLLKFGLKSDQGRMIFFEYIVGDYNFNFEEKIIDKYFDNYHKYCMFMQKYFKCIPIKIYSIKLLKIIDVYDIKKS
jgi:hypothetical protein